MSGKEEPIDSSQTPERQSFTFTLHGVDLEIKMSLEANTDVSKAIEIVQAVFPGASVLKDAEQIARVESVSAGARKLFPTDELSNYHFQLGPHKGKTLAAVDMDEICQELDMFPDTFSQEDQKMIQLWRERNG